MNGVLARVRAKRYGQLGWLKRRAIDVAASRFPFDSVADLGGVWAVDGGYSFYALDRHELKRVVICDEDFTEPVVERARSDARIKLVEANFGARNAADRIGEVDSVFMFDVLLHQVQPDWTEILDLYADQCLSLVAAGPWWNGEDSLRLLDLSKEEYLSVVPGPEFHAEVYERLDEVNEQRGRPWRDSHDIWQWGITPSDLSEHLADLGFMLAHFENHGKWRGLTHFDDCAFVFVKDQLLRRS